MILYLCERYDDIDYDEYISAVICANNMLDAQKIAFDLFSVNGFNTTIIGTAAIALDKGIVLSSFKAG